jgi:maleylpyruvate isomerase
VTRPSERIDLARRGDAFFFAQLEQLDDDALHEPCALPGWTRAHVVGHMARNADALVNLLTWARTGVETPMYPSREARAAGIEATSQKSAAELRADAQAASTRLFDDVEGMPEEAWDAPIRTALGRAIPASEVPWMRIRESWVHTVDLDAGATFEQLPGAVVVDLIDEVASGLAGRADCTPMVVDIRERSWRVGGEGDAVTVSGSAPEVLAWIIGRGPGPSGAPGAPQWL